MWNSVSGCWQCISYKLQSACFNIMKYFTCCGRNCSLDWDCCDIKLKFTASDCWHLHVLFFLSLQKAASLTFSQYWGRSLLIKINVNYDCQWIEPSRFMFMFSLNWIPSIDLNRSHMTGWRMIKHVSCYIWTIFVFFCMFAFLVDWAMADHTHL